MANEIILECDAKKNSGAETKECPFCMGIIHVNAKKCKYCGEILDLTLREIETLKKNSLNIINNNSSNNGSIRSEPVMAPAKSRLIYILLALFFGIFGIHNFYAGYGNRGIVQLLVTLFLGWLIIPLIIICFWVLIEIVVVSSDGRGVAFS